MISGFGTFLRFDSFLQNLLSIQASDYKVFPNLFLIYLKHCKKGGLPLMDNPLNQWGLLHTLYLTISLLLFQSHTS